MTAITARSSIAFHVTLFSPSPNKRRLTVSIQQKFCLCRLQNILCQSVVRLSHAFLRFDNIVI